MMRNRKTQVIKFQLFNLKRLRCDDVQGRLRHFIKCLEERKTLQSCSCSPNFSFISVFFFAICKSAFSFNGYESYCISHYRSRFSTHREKILKATVCRCMLASRTHGFSAAMLSIFACLPQAIYFTP